MVHPDSSVAAQDPPRRRRFLPGWGGLPDFCALAPVVWCFSHAITSLLVGAHVGRQSSTFAIGPVFTVLAAPFLGAVGLAVGHLVRFVLGASLPRSSPLLRRGALLLLVTIGVVAALRASAPIYAAEREARPRVLVNSVQIHRRVVRQPAGNLQRATRVYDYLGKVNSAIQWEDRSVRLAIAGDVLELRIGSTAMSLAIPLPGIDYINCVDAIPLRMGSSVRPVLALLITGRATGRRDLIAVVAASGELLYLELLDRFWNYREVPLAVATSTAGDLVLVGSDPQNLLAFAP